MSIIGNAQKINGWMHLSELLWLAEQAKKAKVIIEVGCYLGRSTKVLADNCSGKIYAVDPWDEFYPDKNGDKHPINPDVYEDFERNLEKEIASGKVVPIQDRFHGQLRLPLTDLIFLDGDHRYATVMHDLIVAEKFINPGGIVAGHDYGHSDWPGVAQAVDRFYHNTTVGHEHSIWFIQY